MQKFLVAAALVGGANAAGHCGEKAAFCGKATTECDTETTAGDGEWRGDSCTKTNCETASGTWTEAAPLVPAACSACPGIADCMGELGQVMDCAADTKNGLKPADTYAKMTCDMKKQWISTYALTSDGLAGAKAADAVVWPANGGGDRRRLAGHAGNCKKAVFASANFETDCADWDHDGDANTATKPVPKLKAATDVTSLDKDGKVCDVAAMIQAECWKFVDCHMHAKAHDAHDRRRMASHEAAENPFCPAEKAAGDKDKSSAKDGSTVGDGSATSAAATLGAFAAVVAMFL